MKINLRKKYDFGISKPSPRKSSSKSPRKPSPRKSSPRKSSSKSPRSPKTINIFLKLDDKIISITIDKNISLKELIEIVLEKFPFLQKIDDIFRIYFSSHKNLYFSETNQNDSLKSFNYFYDNSNYNIMIQHHKEKKETENNFMILKELFSFLEDRNGTCKVIVSLFSSNITDSVEKNLIQQFQYKYIDNDKCIFYVLIDTDFGNKRNDEFYNLINVEKLEITSNEIGSSLDLSIIRKFKLIKPYIIGDKESEYYKLFKTKVEPKIKNSKIIIYYVLRLYITDEIMKFIKEYNNEFEIYSFSGHTMFE